MYNIKKELYNSNFCYHYLLKKKYKVFQLIKIQEVLIQVKIIVRYTFSSLWVLDVECPKIQVEYSHLVDYLSVYVQKYTVMFMVLSLGLRSLRPDM